MSLSQKNLSTIQKAGEAVHGACEAIADTVRTQAEGMVASVASQPFGVESEQAIVRFRTLARLSQGLIEIESQLKGLYAVAMDMANPASDVVVALPVVSKRNAANAAAVDVIAKPAKPSKARPKKAGRKPATLTANDSALLQYLKGVLKTDGWTAQTGAIMAAGSGLPPGSVGVSLKKILALGAVKAGERGMYQLASHAAAPELPSARTRKAMPTAAKKGQEAKEHKV